MMKGVYDEPEYCQNYCEECIEEIREILRNSCCCGQTKEERDAIWALIERMKGVYDEPEFCKNYLPVPTCSALGTDYCNIDHAPCFFCCNEALLTNNRANKGSGLCACNTCSLGSRFVISTGAKIAARPIVAGCRIYFMDISGRVYAACKKTGEIIWSKNVGCEVENGSQSTECSSVGNMTICGGFLYIPSRNGEVYALSLTNGNVVWKRTLSNCLLDCNYAFLTASRS